ncbi:MAG: hypothetical protein ACFFCB_00740 [Candidatus Odinarchaeota archaeon]
MAETNSKLIRILQVLGLLFMIGAGFVAVTNLVFDIPWDQIAAILFLANLLLCGLSFGMAGLMAENPDKIRKYFAEWLVVVGAILIWVVCVYALL